MKLSNEFQNYLVRRGARGERALKALAELGVRINVLVDSPIGAQVLDEDIKRLDDLITKVIIGKETTDDRAEMQYIYRRIEAVVAMIENHKTILEDVKSVGG